MKAGRELDALIAEKVMDEKIGSGHRSMIVHGPFEECDCISHDEAGVLPRYSTQIADAWLVVEKMRERSFRWVINSENHNWDIYLEDRRMGRGEGHTTTAPLAICLAALNAMEEK